MDTPEFLIDLAVQADAPGVVVCLVAAYRLTRPHLRRPPKDLLAICTRLINGGLVYVARQRAGESPRAVLIMQARDDAMVIENLAVHPRYQGRGLGRLLVGYAEMRARAVGLNQVRLFTNEEATGNTAYYESLGYEVVGRQTVDLAVYAIVLRKVLQPADAVQSCALRRPACGSASP